MADGYLNFDTKINTKGFSTGVKQINNQVNGLASAFKKLGAVFGAAFAFKKLIDVGKQAIELGSDIQEVQNVVDTAFGDMAYKSEKFAETAIDNFGMSKLAAKQFSSTYMAMGKGMGLASDMASDMAIETTKRIGDVASFYNKSFSEVDTMMKSIWTGETEALKQIGVVMTETNLEAFALTQGIKKQLSAMTQAEKTQLRYAYVMEQTSLAAGDFAKTSDSWANQTRILSERWKEFLSIIGTGLIQVLAPTVKFLNAIMSKMIEFANTFSTVTAQLFGKQTTITADSKSIEAAASAQGDLADETERAGKAAKGSLASFDEINNLAQKDEASSSSSGDMGGVTAVKPTIETTEVEGQVSEFILRIQELLKPLQEINLDNLRTAFDNFKTSISPLTEDFFSGLKWFYDNILVPFSTWAIEDVIPVFINVLSNAFGVLNSILEVFKPLGEWLWNKFLQPLAVWTGGKILEILGWLSDKLKDLSKWMEDNKTLIGDIALVVGSFALAWGAVNLAVGLWNTIGVIATAVTTAFGAAVAFLTSPIGLVVLAIGAIIAIVVLLIKHWDDVKKAAAWCWNKIKEVWGVASTWFNVNIIEPIEQFFSKLWEDIKKLASDTWGGIKDIWNKVAEWFDTNLIKPVGKFFSKMWNGISKSASNAWDNIKNTFSTVANWFSVKVLDPIKNAFKSVINFLIGLVEGFINGFVKGINIVIGALNKLKIDIPDWLGGGKLGFNIPLVQQLSIPRLARGGIIDSPTLAMIGERGKEAVVPLENTAFVDTLASALGNAVMTAMQFNNSNNNSSTEPPVLQLDGTTFARLINSYLDKENSRQGNRLIQETI